MGRVITSHIATVGGRLRGRPYAEVRALLGEPTRVIPPNRGQSGRGPQAGAGLIEWVIHDPTTREVVGSIRLDMPTPRQLKPNEQPPPQSAENPHLARLLPGGLEHIDEQGVVVPDDSTSAHIEIEEDEALRDAFAHERGSRNR